MDRQKVYEREDFTYDERRAICKKSDNKCCHCGKEKYINYGATIDHFIPLSKGGSNRKINLVMLCEDCNKKKDDKIMDTNYLKYLKPKYKEEISAYLESYKKVFDFIGRNNIFACDEYSFLIPTPTQRQLFHQRRKRQKGYMPDRKYGISHTFKRATFEDFEKICDYYQKYLEKLKLCDGRVAVEENIEFWMNFGVIYYTEKQNEISTMVVFTVRNVNGDVRGVSVTLDKVFNMYLFPYYSTENTFTLCCAIIGDFLSIIKKENNLKMLPFSLKMLKEDKLTEMVMYRYFSYVGSRDFFCEEDSMGFVSTDFYLGHENLCDEEVQQTKDFFKRFDDINRRIIEFVSDFPDNEGIDWMLAGIMSAKEYNYYLKESGKIPKKPEEVVG